jgi:CMP-N,N'-diacetyllegionaminic acid synthase
VGVSTLGVIPARGGSKGIPRKNVRLLGGRPLIAWTIEAALQSGVLDAVVVSTEDAEIAEVARSEGASVPFLRPARLAVDETPGIDPVLHALDQLPGHDTVVLLQPTSPLRTAADIRDCVGLAADRSATSVVSVSPAVDHPFWTYRVDVAGRLAPFVESPPALRRQNLPPAYRLNGAIYLAQVAWLRRASGFVGPDTLAFVMPSVRSIDIDDEADWQAAEQLLRSAA